MLLKESIKEFQDQALPQMKPEVVSTLLKGVADLVADHVDKDALSVGEKLPAFSLPDASGKTISSAKLLEKGPLVISFYRGNWCPYCNLELRALQNHLPAFEENEATLVAISPQTPDNSLSTQEKNDLKFPVLSDSNNKVAKSMGLVFEVPKDVVDVSREEFDLVYSKFNETEKHELPIPATYVVGRDGIVKYAFVNPDYTQRAEPSEVLDVLTSLKKGVLNV